MSNDSGQKIRQMRMVSYCPVCELRSKPMMARVLGKEGDTELMHVTCATCENAFLALVLVNQTGASSVGMLTDLQYDDVMRFHASPIIGMNDVLHLHELLDNKMLRLPKIEQKPKIQKNTAKKRIMKKTEKSRKPPKNR